MQKLRKAKLKRKPDLPSLPARAQSAYAREIAERERSWASDVEEIGAPTEDRDRTQWVFDRSVKS